MKEVILKPLSSGSKEAIISNWFFEEGDHVEAGEDLVEVSFDGLVFNVIVPSSGTLAEVYFEVGDVVEVGEVIAEIEED